MEPKLTQSQRTAIVAGITGIIGAAGGQYVGDLTDPPLLTTQEVVEMQELNRGQLKRFEQILPGGQKPTDAEDKTALRNFPNNIRVDVYDGPLGKGYTIVEELPDRTVSISYGPESESRSYVLLHEVASTSSSTPEKI